AGGGGGVGDRNGAGDLAARGGGGARRAGGGRAIPCDGRGGTGLGAARGAEGGAAVVASRIAAGRVRGSPALLRGPVDRTAGRTGHGGCARGAGRSGVLRGSHGPGQQ